MPHDLTDTWHGRFTFPRLHDPISFAASIEQTGEWLSGTVEAPGMRGVATGKVLTATISGKVTSNEVTFLKTYDAEIASYDAVHYQGKVGDQRHLGHTGELVRDLHHDPVAWSGVSSSRP